MLFLHAALQQGPAGSGFHIIGLMSSILPYPPHLPHIQRFMWVCGRGHIIITLAAIMLKGNKLKGGRWKSNTFLEKWSWAGVTTEPEAQQGCPGEGSPAQGIYQYFLSYNWKPWNAPWFVFFYKDWWALSFVRFGLFVFISHIKKSKIENSVKNIFVGRKC